MKKILIIGAISAVLIVIILTVLAIFAGGFFLWEKSTQWLAGGEKLVTETIKKAEEMVTAVKERVQQEVIPGLTEKVKELVPVGLPEKDVAGEDIKGIPRHPEMVRSFYEIKNQKRTIIYKGRVDFQSVIAHFNKEMTAAGFTKKVVSASPAEEVSIYRKAKRELEFRFKKTGIPGLEITELTIREL